MKVISIHVKNGKKKILGSHPSFRNIPIRPQAQNDQSQKAKKILQRESNQYL